MSLPPSPASSPSLAVEVQQPAWLWELLGVPGPWDGIRKIAGQAFVLRGGIPRVQTTLSDDQAQTEETFGYKWNQRDSFESDHTGARTHEWLIERYGDLRKSDWFREHGERPLLVDAGCGAGLGAMELLNDLVNEVRYLGIDVSRAVDVAATRFAERGLAGAFMQADLTSLPLAPASVDLILSEGVLHHTDSTKGALGGLSQLLKPHGRILFYVYRRKGPIREFTDDFVRFKLQGLTPEEAWKAIEPLTELGIKLGELDATIIIETPIDLLGIPAGEYNLQRFFYWHVAKAFYRPELTFDEMNHINFDWYAPANAARQTPEEVRAWCAEFGLEIEREMIEPAGITIIARKTVA